MKNRKLMNVLLILLPVAAVVLTALPSCVQMRFAAPDPEPAYIEYCSGFSMLPVGYGNWSHMLAGILSGVLAVLAIIRCFRASEKADGWIRGLSAVAASFPVLASVLYHSMTPVSWVIAALLFAETVLISWIRQQ